jgi:hypothetical protein
MWPDDYKSLSSQEQHMFIWLLQSQAKKAGFKVIDSQDADLNLSEGALKDHLEVWPLSLRKRTKSFLKAKCRLINHVLIQFNLIYIID